MTDYSMAAPGYPVSVRARLDEPVSRWLWLVKWILLIPHVIVLAFLWLAFFLVTVAVFFVVLFTGRYPRALFDFDLGVLRWSWRVSYYGYSALGTDRYPPFTLGPAPDYPATLDIAYPERLSRGLVLVKWWLLAIPHYLILAVLIGGAVSATSAQTDSGDWQWTAGVGLLRLCVLFVAIALLFTARYPPGLYNLVMGVNRWSLRVFAYVALMTDRYPPFRLDQGGDEPVDPRGPQPTDQPAGYVPVPAPATPMAGGPATPMAGGPAPAPVARRGIAGPVIALVAGLLLFLPGAGMGVIGVGALWLNAQRDDDGYYTTATRVLSTDTAAVTAEDVDLDIDRGPGTWASNLGRIRIRATETDGRSLFIGIAREADVDSWLRGVAHDEIRDIDDDVRYRRQQGTATAETPPTEETFWVASATGSGTRTVTWLPETGQWALVIARADGSPGVRAEVDVGARAPSVAGVGIGLLIGGLLLIVLSVVLVVIGATGLGRRATGPPGPPGWYGQPAAPPPQPVAPRAPESQPSAEPPGAP